MEGGVTMKSTEIMGHILHGMATLVLLIAVAFGDVQNILDVALILLLMAILIKE